MKNILIATFTLIASTTSAQADQYTLYVTHAERVSPNQVQLTSMVQKNILIDTKAKTVRVSFSPICTSGFCPEVLQTVSFKLTGIQKQGSRIVKLSADGAMVIQGKATATRLIIAQNQNNATTIQFTSASAPSASISVFHGSPTEASNLLF